MNDVWPEIEICEEPASWRLFWETVLEYAAAQRAARVVLVPEWGESCLAIEIDGQMCPLDPPPQEYLVSIMTTGRALVAGAGLPGALKLLSTRWLGRTIRGVLHSNGVEWRAICSPRMIGFAQARIA